MFSYVFNEMVMTFIIPLYTYTDLRKQEERGELVKPVLFVLLVLVSVLLYFAVSLMDPGFVLSDDSDAQVCFNLCSCYYIVNASEGYQGVNSCFCILQFALGVTEEQQDMIPHTPKSLRLRRCGHCLLQVF